MGEGRGSPLLCNGIKFFTFQQQHTFNNIIKSYILFWRLYQKKILYFTLHIIYSDKNRAYNNYDMLLYSSCYSIKYNICSVVLKIKGCKSRKERVKISPIGKDANPERNIDIRIKSIIKKNLYYVI